MNPLFRRFQQGTFEALASMNRLSGSGGGSGFQLQTLGFAAAGNQGAFSTANSSTWTDITNTSFTIAVPRVVPIEFRIGVGAHLSAAGALGYVRGNIVG